MPRHRTKRGGDEALGGNYPAIESSAQSDLVLTSHTGTVRDVCFLGPHAGCHALLSGGGGDCTVRMWDVGVGCREPLRRLAGHTGAVHCLQQVGADGRHVASGSADGTVRLWDLRCHASGSDTSSAVAVLKLPPRQATATAGEAQLASSAVLCLTSLGAGHNGGGTCIAAGHADHSCTVWDLRTRTVACQLHHHNADCRSVDGFVPGARGSMASPVLGPTPSPRWLLSASFDNTAAVTDVHPSPSQRRVLRVFNHDGARVLHARWHTTACAFVSTAHSTHNSVRLWADPNRMMTGSEVKKL